MSAGREGLWQVDPRGLKPARLVPPVSKSDAQRAQALAHAAGRPDWVELADAEHELPEDVRVMRRGLKALREGTGVAEIDCRDGGAPFRILLSLAAVTLGREVRFMGSPRLGERPHGPLLEALTASLAPAGLKLEHGSPWPLTVHAPPKTAEPRFKVLAAESSQFASGLLIAAAACVGREQRRWTVELVGPTASQGYLELTVEWLKRYGFGVEKTSNEISITGWSEPRQRPALPGDWSSLGYLLLAAWRAGGTVARVDLEAAHPDRAVLDVLDRVGITVEPCGPGEVRVKGAPQGGLTATGKDCPDLLPTLAALACVLPGPSTLLGVEVLRHKESDRLAGILELCTAAGARATHEPQNDRILIAPGKVPPELRMHTRNDHRLAMSAATLSVLTGSLCTLDAPDCVAKSFPGFWSQLEQTGVMLAAVQP
jgi:3-phosphoshikimate 1-carboxyvinyltransferase